MSHELRRHSKNCLFLNGGFDRDIFLFPQSVASPTGTLAIPLERANMGNNRKHPSERSVPSPVAGSYPHP